MATQALRSKIRRLILFFVIMLILSGVTAFPVETELAWLMQYVHLFPKALADFLTQTHANISAMNRLSPTLAYGYDWLAFAHIVIGMAFIGPYRDPVRNIWVIEWAMLACIAVLPLAFIMGPIRDIPFFWRLIDCSFGVFGIIPLWVCRNWIMQLDSLQQNAAH